VTKGINEGYICPETSVIGVGENVVIVKVPTSLDLNGRRRPYTIDRGHGVIPSKRSGAVKAMFFQYDFFKGT
jgi:hypothetical protein